MFYLMKMSAKGELEKLHSIRAELEAESRLLIDEQQNLEKCVRVLEDKILAEEIRKENALVEDLRSRNEAAKTAIAQLEDKKKELEGRLEKFLESSGVAIKAREAGKTTAKPEKVDEVPEEEDFPEDAVTITVLESEEMVEPQEGQEKRNHRFF
jgi:septal ring factor EnvC (AmiA/AmiB activator)